MSESSFSALEYWKNPEQPMQDFRQDDVEMLFLQLDFMTFLQETKALLKRYKAEIGDAPKFDLVFSLDDPDFGTSDAEKVGRLRQLKALLESKGNSKVADVIASITVKGSDPHGAMIEPNVFSSGVKYEVLK